jgi:hypothetical protein
MFVKLSNLFFCVGYRETSGWNGMEKMGLNQDTMHEIRFILQLSSNKKIHTYVETKSRFMLDLIS